MHTDLVKQKALVETHLSDVNAEDVDVLVTCCGFGRSDAAAEVTDEGDTRDRAVRPGGE